MKNFNKRDVEHDPGGKTGGDGKKTVVGLLGQKGNGAADARGHAREKG